MRPPDADITVGRSAELHDIFTDLQSSRLVVLTGPGGIGKTSLALAAADRMRPMFQNGVGVAELGSLPAERDSEIMALKNVQFAVQQLTGTAANSSDLSSSLPSAYELNRLIILDNAEHVIEAATRVCAQMLDQYPGLHAIMTSRRRIAFSSIQTLEIGPLAVDWSGRAERPAAMELFVRRAQPHLPSTNVRSLLADIAELCQRLEGLPVAIELAAQLLRSVSLETLLSDDLTSMLLNQIRPARLAHQRSLLDSVKWDYDLLDDDHRALLHYIARKGKPVNIDDIKRFRQPYDTNNTSTQLLADLADTSLVEVRPQDHYQYEVSAIVRVCLERFQDEVSGQS